MLVAEETSNGLDGRVTQQVRFWRDELLSLGRRSRVLYFRPTKSATLEVKSPGLVEVLARLEQRNGAWSFYMPPTPPVVGHEEIESTKFDPLAVKPLRPHEVLTQKQDIRSIENSLQLLDRKATQEFMDKGIWVLYLATGFMHWVDPEDQKPVRTPIVLVPVRLARASPRDPYSLVLAEDEIAVNPAMLAMLETDFGIKLPPFDDTEDVDVVRFLREVEKAVRPRGWTVLPEVFLDTFSFHKEVMYRDLLANENAIVGHGLIRTLALGADADVDLGFVSPSEAELDELHPPEETTTILDADASQRVCIAAARANRTFVMDGPPGTGKSQTIANLIAQSLKDGRTVLFVSEKIAALEVVKARLDGAGLGEYLLEMHSHKATRKDVALALYESLLKRPKPPTGISEQSVSSLRKRRKDLSDYAQALNELRPGLGRSLFSALGRASQLQNLPQPPIPQEIDGSLGVERFNEIVDSAGDLKRAWAPVARRDEFMWHGLKVDQASFSGKRQIQETLTTLASEHSRLEQITQAIASDLELWWNRAPAEAPALLGVLNHLQNKPSVPALWLTAPSLDPVKSATTRLTKDWATWHVHDQHLKRGLGQQWRKIKSQSGSILEASLDELARLDPGVESDPSLHARAIRIRSDFGQRSAEFVGSVKAAVDELAKGLGLDPTGISIETAFQFALLSDLIAAVNAPEQDWLDPLALPILDEANDILRKLVDASRRKAEELASQFRPEIVDLDLETLKARFDTLHRGLRKLGPAYRADKRSLGNCTRTGKATKQDISALGAALDWQRIKADLADAEKRHASVLGNYYYRGESTDFGDIASALEVARNALELAGKELANRKLFASQLGRAGSPDPVLKRIGSEIRGLIGQWRADAQQSLGPMAAALDRLSLESLAAWSYRLFATGSQAAEVFERSDAIAQRSLQLDEVLDLLKVRETVDQLEGQIAATWDEDVAVLGPGYQAMDTEWIEIGEGVEWAAQFRELVRGPLDDLTASRMLTTDIDPEDLHSRLDRWTKAQRDLSELFEKPFASALSADLGSSYADSRQLLDTMLLTVGDIDEWATFVRSRESLKALGLGGVVDFMVTTSVETDTVANIIERATLVAWADRLIETDLRLKSLRSEERDSLVQDFRRLDRQLIEGMTARVVVECNSRRPVTTIGAAGIIAREGQKKRRHMPVRDLIEGAASVVQALKPCFMMSPLSVSQFLTSSVSFDVVIFDEASQVKPADAVNCIYRGRQLVVAGDQKQLPPTSFFDRVTMDGGDEYDEEGVDEFESVLDLAKAGGVPSLPLRWHYRSQHEDLITYSNYSFYDGRLVTFPSAQATGSDIGLEFFLVDGQYRRGGARDNPIEADAVADRVLFHARHHSDLTLGVVAFSEAQASTIERVLDQKRRSSPDLDDFFKEDRLSGFFIKNLENVQGDERDIVIFSIGYGPDEVGKLTMNFGPLNKPGGQRRLNVAITRARRRVEVVSSIRPDDFSHTPSEGPRHLRRYLDFVSRGMPALAIEVQQHQRDSESPFEEEILRVVRGWGYDAVPQVGVAEYRIDVGVTHPDKPGLYVLAIECDGAMYHSSPVARDRDRLRQEVLEGLGWTVYRVWGPAWYRDRVGEERRLKEAIESAIRGIPRAPRSVPRALPPEVVEKAVLDQKPSWVEEYQACRPRVTRGYEIHSEWARRTLDNAIEEVIAVEAPLSQELLLNRVREAWGLGRAGSRVRDAFALALERLKKGKGVRIDRYGFLWLPGQELTIVRVPSTDPDSFRTQPHLPWEELRLAVVNLVRDARSVSEDELTSAIARLFGWAGRGPDISAALDEAVRYLVKNGQLVRKGAYLTLASAPTL